MWEKAIWEWYAECNRTGKGNTMKTTKIGSFYVRHRACYLAYVISFYCHTL